MSRTAILVNNLAKRYSNRGFLDSDSEEFWALKDVSFEVLEGEILCVLGESGSGKSTLSKLLVGAIEATAGQLIVDNKDISNLTESRRLQHNRRIRMVFQDTLGSLNPSLTLGKILLEPLVNMTQLDPDEQHERILKVLELVGLKSEHLSRLPHSFSAGERQKIAIARALVMEPVCIIADEPLSSLESSAQSQIINLILDLQKNLNLSFIMVTQDANVIKHMGDKLMVLCRGRLVEFGPAQEVIANPMHPYTRHFLDVTIHNPKIQSTEVMDASLDACVYHDRCELATDKCREVQPVFHDRNGHLICCHHVDDSI